jgi:hypothetical protein
MRRLLAINLTVVLLAPWLAALSGAVVPVVPCPMHRSAGATSHDHAGVVAEHDKSLEHHSPSRHGTTAQGCNCAGECGRSGTAFSLPAKMLLRESSSALAEAACGRQEADFGAVARLLPDATGPPQRLQI